MIHAISLSYKKKKRKEKEHKRYVITINYEQQYRRYRFFFNAFPRERQPQEIVRQGQTLHRFETLWNFPNDKHQLSAKESAIFSSLRRENLTRFSIRNIYIYILSWQFRCRNVDKRPFSGTHYRSDTVYSSPRWTSPVVRRSWQNFTRWKW